MEEVEENEGLKSSVNVVPPYQLACFISPLIQHSLPEFASILITKPNSVEVIQIVVHMVGGGSETRDMPLHQRVSPKKWSTELRHLMMRPKPRIPIIVREKWRERVTGVVFGTDVMFLATEGGTNAADIRDCTDSGCPGTNM